MERQLGSHNIGGKPDRASRAASHYIELAKLFVTT